MDPRRYGFVAFVCGAAYGAVLFVGGSWWSRAAFAAGAAVLGTAGVLLGPLPRWQESEDRRRLAGMLMVCEAAAIAAVLTIVRVATR